MRGEGSQSWSAASPGRARRKRRRGAHTWVDWLLPSGAVLIVAGLAAWGLKDRLDSQAAAPTAQREWAAAQAPIEARLNQNRPLEYGAVWATHSGLICGLVAGWGSFGGFVGMTRFYVYKGRPVFAEDVKEIDFAPGWIECNRDHWIKLRDGTETVGFCATHLGAKRCKPAD